MFLVLSFPHSIFLTEGIIRCRNGLPNVHRFTYPTQASLMFSQTRWNLLHIYIYMYVIHITHTTCNTYYTYIYLSVCVCVCVYICMYTCIYIYIYIYICFYFSVSNSCPNLCNPMDCSTLGYPVVPNLLEFALPLCVCVCVCVCV